MMRRFVGARRSSRQGSRGAVAVEAALVTVPVITLLLGIIEFSFIFRDDLAVASVVRVGARIASANANAGPGSATCTPAPCTPPSTPAFAALAANAIQQAGTAMPKDAVDYIMVYQANSKGFPAPASTPTGSIPTNAAVVGPSPTSTTPCSGFANCVAYRWVDATDAFTYASGTWSSASVDACPTSGYNVGVWMHATHRNVTGFFGSTKGLSDKTVMKFEPLPATSCNPSAPQPHL